MGKTAPTTAAVTRQGSAGEPGETDQGHQATSAINGALPSWAKNSAARW